ncbi:ABC transporter ATP-binding protein, partial [Pseudomonas sp. S37]|nr:ABC transporter ATP-binding protein [Pseudomonas sp. S37]
MEEADAAYGPGCLYTAQCRSGFTRE